MGKLLRKKLYFALIYAMTAVLVEIISFSVMGFGVFPSFWGIDIAFILGFAVLIFIIPSSVASIVFNGVVLFFQVAVVFINEALYSMSGMVFSLDMINLVKEVGGVFSADFVNWWLFAGMILLYAAEMAALILLHKNIRTERAHFTRNAVIVLLVCCIIGENASMILYQATISTFQSTTVSDELADYNDDKLLYTTQFIPAKALKKFGSFGFYFMNFSNMLGSLIGGSNGGRQELSALDNYFSQGEMSESAYGENIYTGALNGKNIVLIVIESGEWYGINREYTPTLYAMASGGISFTEYYARDKTNVSEAMSILGSYPKNSDPSTKLKNAQLSFTLPNLLRENNYTTNYFHANNKSFYNRDVTHGGGKAYGFDTSHFLDDMPVLDGCDEEGNIVKKSFYDFDRDSLVTKNYFSEYSYKQAEDTAFFTQQMTLSSHGTKKEDILDIGDYPFNDERYYDSDMTQEEREAEQKKLKEAFSKDASIKGFEKYYEIIDGYAETFIGDKGVRLDTDPDTAIYSPSKLEEIYFRYKRYQAALMDLDEAVNSLVYDLQRTGQLDDTAFVFYADHSAYYNNQNYYLKGVTEGETWNTALYNIPCFIWYGGSMDCDLALDKEFYEGYHSLTFRASKDKSSALQGGVIVDKFACSFDILPTILQLTGYNYNLNLYQGVSMFSDRTSVFVSQESNTPFTNTMYFDGITVFVEEDDGSWTQYDYEGTLYTDEGFSDEVKAFLKASLKYYEKQQMLEEMYKLDYFSRRPIFGSVAKDGAIFHYVQRADEK